MEQLDFTRNAGETRRFHTWPVLRQQNVAEHSWHVAMLVWILYGQVEPGIRLPSLMAALTHDMAEWKVGDVPSPAKRSMDKRIEVKGNTFRAAWNDMEEEILAEQGLDWGGQLTVEEAHMLGVADCMDGALYCIRERAMGNALITPCYMNFSNYIDELLGDKPTEMEQEVRGYITTQWELVNVS